MALIKKDLPIEVVGGKYRGRHGMLRDTMRFMCYVDLNGVPGDFLKKEMNCWTIMHVSMFVLTRWVSSFIHCCSISDNAQ